MLEMINHKHMRVVFLLDLLYCGNVVGAQLKEVGI